MLVSCGLETYVYFYPVTDIFTPSGGTSRTSTITLPSSQPPEFTNYLIYYRIYLTNLSNAEVPTFTGVTSDILYAVNPQLASHYAYLEQFTLDDYTPTSSIDMEFRNRGYFALSVSPDGINEKPIEQVLDTITGTLQIMFFDDPYPSLTDTSNNKYYLFRAKDFTSQPGRRFTNPDQLENYTPTNLVNADVQFKADVSPTPYAYVSMYIVASGYDTYYAPIYSRPTLIGIFPIP